MVTPYCHCCLQFWKHWFYKWIKETSPKIPQITLCPPGACPPESTTPTFSAFPSTASLAGTNVADGCPNKLGNSFAISSVGIRSKPTVRPKRAWTKNQGMRQDQGQGTHAGLRYPGSPWLSWEVHRRGRIGSRGRRGAGARDGGGSSAPRCKPTPTSQSQVMVRSPPPLPAFALDWRTRRCERRGGRGLISEGVRC